MRRYQYGLWLGAAVSIAAAAGIAMPWVEIGSADGRWTYRYIQPLSVHALTVGSIAAGTAVAAPRLTPPETGRREWAAGLFWLLLATILQAFISQAHAAAMCVGLNTAPVVAKQSGSERNPPGRLSRRCADLFERAPRALPSVSRSVCAVAAAVWTLGDACEYARTALLQYAGGRNGALRAVS